MILASWNVNSISIRKEQIINWLNAYKPNVLCIQETKVQDEKFPCADFEEAGYHCAFYGQRTYNGVAIIASSPIAEVERNFLESPLPDHARFITGKIDGITVMNAYVPNGGLVGSQSYEHKLDWLKGLRTFLDRNKEPLSKACLCGDFNVAPEDRDVYDPVATKGQILVSDEEREALNHLKDWGFEDAFRMHNEEAGHYTWWDYRALAFQRKMGFRIDHIWLSQELKPFCKASWIDRQPRKNKRPSDHTPIVVELDL
ncbi:MAG: exodeoxyribonuclease III [Cyanobacteria bacterium]|nr:exodeoxyribonuclease III [Cyanobacteriota bacterium]